MDSCNKGRFLLNKMNLAASKKYKILIFAARLGILRLGDFGFRDLSRINLKMSNPKSEIKNYSSLAQLVRASDC
jgi:hypothetical protein